LLEEPNPLVERSKPRDPVPAVEELRRAGEYPKKPGVRPGCVCDLTDSVQGLVAGIAPHSENCLRLVDDDEQALVAGRLNDLEDTAKIVEGVPARNLPLDVHFAN
jgi:hypothetical protein